MGDNPKKFIGREGEVFVYILHFIILNNLFVRESYWYCLVHVVKFHY